MKIVAKTQNNPCKIPTNTKSFQSKLISAARSLINDCLLSLLFYFIVSQYVYS